MRDRRDRLNWILSANVALLALAYAVYAIVVYTHRTMAVDVSWGRLLVAPLVAFAVGRVLPYAVSPLLGSIRLPPGAPGLVSFLLPCLAGLGFLGVPLLIYWLASPQLGKTLAASQSRHSRRRGVRGDGSGYRRVSLRSAVAVFGRTSGDKSAIDDCERHGPGVLGGTNAGSCRPAPHVASTCSVGSDDARGSRLAPRRRDRAGDCRGVDPGDRVGIRRLERPDPGSLHSSARAKRRRTSRLRGKISRSVPADVQELVQRVENPDYQQFPLFDRGWDRVRGFLEGRCLHLGLYGAQGCGQNGHRRGVGESPGAGIREPGLPARALVRDLPTADRRTDCLRSLSPSARPTLRSQPAGAAGGEASANRPSLGRHLRIGHSFRTNSLPFLGGRRRLRRQAGGDSCRDHLDAAPTGQVRPGLAPPGRRAVARPGFDGSRPTFVRGISRRERNIAGHRSGGQRQGVFQGPGP